MGRKGFSKRNLAREAAEKNPSADNRTLARLLVRQHKGVWRDIDQARGTVRQIRGVHGKLHRTKGVATHPKIEIPEPDNQGWKNRELPTDIERWLIISDIHMPYHSAKALRIALDYGIADGCDGLIINGDGLDFCTISRFENDPRNRDFAGEVDMMKRFLGNISPRFKKRIYKAGNHEARLPTYLMQRIPEVFKKIEKHASFGKLLGLKRSGFEFIHDKHTLSHRELTIVHGHEWGAGVFNPVNPARGAFIRAHDNVLQGHSHRTSDHTETTLRDVAISCWSAGCLCHLHPLYRPIANRWNHGFAILETGPAWRIKNHRIISEEKVT